MLAVLTAGAGCGGVPTKVEQKHRVALASLRAIETYERARADYEHLPTADEVMGADPYRVEALADGRFVGILRGADALSLLDRTGKEIARVATLAEPVGLAVRAQEVVVIGEAQSSEMVRYRVVDDVIEEVGRSSMAMSVAPRDVAFGPDDTVYVVDEQQDALLSLSGANVASKRICAGPFEVEVSRSWLAFDCLIDHRVAVQPFASQAAGFAIEHDGPIWSMAIHEHDDGMLTLALGGVENVPLDRSGGFFGNIDSFVFFYRIDGAAPRLIAEVNVSQQGVVTPKAMLWTKPGRELLVTGYGGEKAAWLELNDESVAVKKTAPLPPGSNDIAMNSAGDLLIANPLLDGWMTLDGHLETAEGGRRAPEHAADVHLGEVMFFTSLMAPFNSSEGKHSRFSCETCHLEGYVDGRTHHTGRGDVHATTKPLLGLFNNRPYFTRGLDPDLTQVSHAEFRVAGQASGADPWFTLDASKRPWLKRLVGRDAIAPVDLRRALMRFLMAFNHRPNPRSRDRDTFTDEEKSGAALFRDRCTTCHAARLVSDDPSSEVPFGRWEALVMGRHGPILWSSTEHQKTGVEPYVHDRGAVTTSLRRLYKKRPYFTNGSAKTLDQVLSRVRFSGGAFFHGGAPRGAAALSPEEQRALLAFLRLL
jgi:hypothetical protein